MCVCMWMYRIVRENVRVHANTEYNLLRLESIANFILWNFVCLCVSWGENTPKTLSKPSKIPQN